MSINSMLCSNNSCKPWMDNRCPKCSFRPFKIYQGNGNTDAIKEICQRLNIHGVMVSPGGCSNPTKRFSHFAVDNGAFSAYVNGTKWNGRSYEKYLNNHLRKGVPDFIITPDQVAKGNESLKFSIGWNRWIRMLYPAVDQYLAVQDGMRPENVERFIPLFNGIFIGGSLDWKYSTATQWSDLAHKYRMPCHIGRVGTKDRIMWARWDVMADSIDSSSWAQNNSWHHIEDAFFQRTISAMNYTNAMNDGP